MQESVLDIGAGTGDYITRRARNEPDKTFLVYEPNYSPTLSLPSNLRWEKKGITTKGLTLPSSSFDEVHLNRVLPDIRERGGDKLTEKLLKEALRILRKGRTVYIREPKYSVAMLEPTLKKLRLNYRVEPIQAELALEISESLRETAQEFLAGDEGMEPYLVLVGK